MTMTGGFAHSLATACAKMRELGRTKWASSAAGVAPTFEKPQPERIFAINLHVMFDIAILSARPMHVLETELQQINQAFTSRIH